MLLAVSLVVLAIQNGEAQPPAAATNAEPKTNSTALKPHQTVSTGEPPRSPVQFNPDTGAPPPTNFLAAPETRFRLERSTNRANPLPPAVFNPDPGASFRAMPAEQPPFFTNEFDGLPRYNGEPIGPGLGLPRTNVFGSQLERWSTTNAPPYRE